MESGLRSVAAECLYQLGNSAVESVFEHEAETMTGFGQGIEVNGVFEILRDHQN
jgi:hypothetical protein